MNWICSSCGETVEDVFDSCWSCGQVREGLQEVDPDAGVVDEPATVEEIDLVVLTTAPSLEGFRVIETLDVVTAECVLGVDFVQELFADMSDLWGGRSETIQRAFRDARATCLFELRREARVLGGNAVIAVDLDYNEFTGGGKSMLFLVASGTAVRVEQVEEPDAT